MKEILNDRRSKITNITTNQNYLTFLSNNQNEIHLKVRCEKGFLFPYEDVTKLKEADISCRLDLLSKMLDLNKIVEGKIS